MRRQADTQIFMIEQNELFPKGWGSGRKRGRVGREVCTILSDTIHSEYDLICVL